VTVPPLQGVAYLEGQSWLKREEKEKEN